MSTFLRWFSPAYRYALKAEAEGRYIEAARAYALCGQPLKVAEMHILEAECRGAPASALRELHVAAHFAEQSADSAAARALLHRLGHIYLRVLKKSVLTPADRDLCHEAAQVLLRAGDPLGAAEAYELGGDPGLAARAYEQAGDVDKVESLLGQLESLRQTQDVEIQLQKSFETQCELGQRSAALATMDQLCAVARDPTAAHQQRSALRARLLSPFVVRLRVSGAADADDTTYVGRLPVVLGRDAQPQSGGAELDVQARSFAIALGDPGLSRSHAQIEAAMDGPGFRLRDLDSKNGTTLGGLAVAGVLPLRGQGEIGLGQQVLLRYRVEGPAENSNESPQLSFEVTRGLSRGLRVRIAQRPIVLPGRSAGGEERLELAFAATDGQPWLTADHELRLNGKRVAPRLQLLRGDVIETAEAPSTRIEVL